MCWTICICILFAYLTNRAFVFASRTQGREALKEFGAFVTCRLGTLVLDAAIMMVFGNLLAAQGAALVDELYERCAERGGRLVWPGYGAAHGAPAAQRPLRPSRTALPPLPSLAVPTARTAIFVTGFYDAQALWGLAVKIFSNVVVVVLNLCSAS